MSKDTRAPLTPMDWVIRLLLVVGSLLIVLCLVLTVVFFTAGPRTSDPADSTPENDGGSQTVTDTVTLPATPDAGKKYQDSIVFVGDSLTAHLIRSEKLTGGRDTKQVWRAENNMLNLNSEVTSAKIVYPETGDKLTIAEAAAQKKPEILIITLGTDWGVAYLNEKDFKSCYTELIKDIQKASPNTKIILQSIFPVTADCALLDNAKIDNANKWVKAIAADTGCRYLDTQSVLKDDKNFLKAEYCNSSDGIHLHDAAYEVILQYIRTHALTD